MTNMLFYLMVCVYQISLCKSTPPSGLPRLVSSHHRNHFKIYQDLDLPSLLSDNSNLSILQPKAQHSLLSILKAILSRQKSLLYESNHFPFYQ